MPRKALIIGINEYDVAGELYGCVNDANRMYEILHRHETGERNFDCTVITTKVSDSDGNTTPVKKTKHDTTTKGIKSAIENLFSGEEDVSLLYFSGHGDIRSYGGYLATKNSEKYQEGVPMSEVLEMANRAVFENRHKEVVIILDCCYSGKIGNPTGIASQTTTINKGISILTSSQDYQVSSEENKRGVFSSIITEALNGSASDILGQVTVAALYRFADQLLSSWDGQRPVFIAHNSQMIVLRKCTEKLPLNLLLELPTLFPDREKNFDSTKRSVGPFRFELNPSFEPLSDSPDPANCETFAKLQKLNRFGLVVPYELEEHESHMYFAAMKSTGCELTLLGEFYRKLADEERI